MSGFDSKVARQRAQHEQHEQHEELKKNFLHFLNLFGSFDMELLQKYLSFTKESSFNDLYGNDKKDVTQMYQSVERILEQFPKNKRICLVTNFSRIFEESKQGPNSQNECYKQDEVQALKQQLRYNEEIIRKHKDKAESLERKNQENLDRISKMMAAQEIGRRDAHENLMDSNRPSVIADKWRSLYLNEYGMLSAVIHETTGMEEQEICIMLVNILELAMDICGARVEKAKKEVTQHLEERFQTKPFAEGTKEPLSKHVFENICSLLREAPHKDVLREIEKGILADMEKENDRCVVKMLKYIGKDNKDLKKYLRSCVKVTWLMNSCNPPMAISTDHTQFNNKMHQKFNGKGPYIDYFLWPCLYFSEDYKTSKGSVMSKGDVAVMTHPPPQQTSIQPPGKVVRHHHKPNDLPPKVERSTEKLLNNYPVVPDIPTKLQNDQEREKFQERQYAKESESRKSGMKFEQEGPYREMQDQNVKRDFSINYGGPGIDSPSSRIELARLRDHHISYQANQPESSLCSSQAGTDDQTLHRQRLYSSEGAYIDVTCTSGGSGQVRIADQDIKPYTQKKSR